MVAVRKRKFSMTLDKLVIGTIRKDKPGNTQQPVNESQLLTLLPEVIYHIISKLDYVDVTNLASTCSHMFKLIINSPSNVKPIIRTDEVALYGGRMKCVVEIEKNLFIPIKLKIENCFNFINQFDAITCRYFTDYESDCSEYERTLKFISENFGNFGKNFRCLSFGYPDDKVLNEKLFSHVVRLFDKISIDSENPESIQDIQNIILNTKYFKEIKCHFNPQIDFCRSIIQEVINGERPLLVYLSFHFSTENSNKELFEEMSKTTTRKTTFKRLLKVVVDRCVYCYVVSSWETEFKLMRTR